MKKRARFYFKAAQKLNEDVPSYMPGPLPRSYIATSQSHSQPGEGLLGGWGNHAHYWMIKKAGQ